MRITEGQLRRIIREEAHSLQEAGAADRFKRGIASKMKVRTKAVSEDQKLANAVLEALTSGVSADDALDELINATFSSDGRGGGDHRAADIIALIQNTDPVAASELDAAFEKYESDREFQDSIDRRY